MDVEKVQKINRLALDLLKQGLVEDKEEAVRQAERLLSKKDYSSLRETMDEEVKELDLDEEGKEAGKAEEALGQDKIKDILEKNAAFMVQKMKEYQEQIEGLKKEVSSLRSEVSMLRSSNLRREEAALKEAPQQKLETGRKDSVPADHPRSGSYRDSDVSIEKFFYSGSRPKN